ncbi:MAG: AraC family transcriptional regulator [Clostridia bacterium]|nr:AraC family transcriptional regulator [Clostridia bacterium]
METIYEIKKPEFYFRTEGKEGKVRLGCPPHMHAQIEFFLLLEGEMSISVDSVGYKMSEGDLCLVFPNQIHAYRPTKKERYMLVIMDSDIVPEIKDVFKNRIPKSSVIRRENLPEEILPLMRKMEELKLGDKGGEYKEILLKSALLSFFGEVFQKLDFVDTKSVNSNTLKKVVDFCSDNFASDLSLDILEENLHISKYYISHLFSMKLKVKFNDYINSLRITEACGQLLQTDQTITEISQNVGFNTLRTFNRAFARRMGMSPSEYRRLGQKQTHSVSTII